MPNNSPLTQLTDANFSEVVEQPGVIAMVEFWASWCMPCRMLEPVVRQVAESFGDQIKVALVDTDKHRDTAQRFEINAVPTIVLFRDGEVIHRVIGLTSFEKLAGAIDAALAASHGATGTAAG